MLLILAVGALLHSPASAADLRSGPEARVGPDEEVEEDLYLAAGTVVMEGTLAADLLAAGGRLEIRGPIAGNLNVAGGTIEASGPVGGAIRVAGGRIRVAEAVGRDILASGGEILLDDGATVGGDAIVSAGSARLGGRIEGDLRLQAGMARLDGQVGGDVHARVDEPLRLGPEARVGGDLVYVSRHPAVLEPGAEVAGTLEHRLPTTTLLGFRVQENATVLLARALVRQVRVFLGIALVGLLLLWLAPRALTGAGGTLRGSPWMSLGVGLLVLVFFPIVLAIIAGLVLWLVGPAGVAAILVPGAAYLVLLSLAAPVVAWTLGDLLVHRAKKSEPRKASALLLGAGLLALVGLLPVFGPLAALLVLLLGFGAWVLRLWRWLRDARFPTPAPT